MNYPASTDLPVRSHVEEAHKSAIEAYALPGTWLDGATRVAILIETRHAANCDLCARRKTALSPYAVDGKHDAVTDLPEAMIEIVHRIATDSGRMTESWFNRVTGEAVTQEAYIEIVGLVATSIIIDSFAIGLGCDIAEPPVPQDGEPSREKNPNVFDGGAWVPMLDVAQEATELEIPSAPNIYRSMGLVPGAIAHFFGVMRSQYSLTEYDISINRSQIELLASRVSSLNQCFY